LIAERIGVDGETSRPDDPAVVGTVGEASTDVTVSAAGVDELDDRRTEAEIRPPDVVDEDVVAAAKRVPLKAKHHERHRCEGNVVVSHRPHNQKSRVGTYWASGNTRRHRQQRRVVGAGGAIVSDIVDDLLVDGPGVGVRDVDGAVTAPRSTRGQLITASS
jgi:hypothetical protein